AGKSLVVDIDDERPFALRQRQRLGDDGGKFRIDQNDLGAAVIELEGDRGRIETDVQRVEHGARHRHGKVRLVHRGNVRQHGSYRIATTDAPAFQARGTTTGDR